MRCTQCEHPLSESDAFCPECGKKRPAGRTCSQCGTSLEDKHKFCPECGHTIEKLTCSCGAALKPKQKFCGKCGKRVEQPREKLVCAKCQAPVQNTDESFCSECGEPLASADALPTPTPCTEVNKSAAATGGVAKETFSDNATDKAAPRTKQEGGLSNEKEGKETAPENAQDSAQVGTAKATPGSQSDATERTFSSNATGEASQTKQAGGLSNEEEKAPENASHSTQVCVVNATPSSQADTPEETFSDNGTIEALSRAGQEGGLSNEEQGTPENAPDSTQVGAPNAIESSQSDAAEARATDEAESLTKQGERELSNEEEGKETAPDSTLVSTADSASRSDLDPKETDTDSKTGGEDGLQRLSPENQELPSDSADGTDTLSQELQNASHEQTAENTPSTDLPDVTRDSGLETGHQQFNHDVTVSTVESEPRSSGGSEVASYRAAESTRAADEGGEGGGGCDSTNTPHQPAENNDAVHPLHSDDQSVSDKETTASGGLVDSSVDPLQRADSTESAGAEGGEGSSDSDGEGADRSSGRSRETSRDRTGAPDAGQQSQTKARRRKPNPRQRKRQRKREAQTQATVVNETFEVKFHVVMSKQFKQLQRNNHRVFVCWKPEDKQFHNYMQEVTFTGRSAECGSLYEGSVDARRLPQGLKFTYRYCIQHEDKFEWEKVYHSKKENREDKCSREMQIRPAQMTQKGTWNVYDWVAYPEGLKGVIDFIRKTVRLSSSRDMFANDMYQAASLFFPTCESILSAMCPVGDGHYDSQLVDYLGLIKLVFDSVPYSASAGDRKDFASRCIHDHLITPLIDQMRTALHTGKRTVVLAVFVHQLADHWALTFNWTARNLVLRAMLIKPNLQKETCPDVDDLHHFFPGLMRNKKAFVRKVVSFMETENADRNPSWIYAVPLLHLLGDGVAPFRTPAHSDKHRTPGGEWWGLRQLEPKNSAFKSATLGSGWYFSHPKVFQELSGAFKADPLMLKTFLATLHADQAIHVLFAHSSEFPIDAVIASVFYHHNTSLEICHRRHQDVVQILNSVTERVKAACLSSKTVTTGEAEMFRCSAAIAIDLLEEVICTHRDDAIVDSVMLLQLTLLKVLAISQPEKRKTRQSDLHLLVVNSINFIEKWQVSTCARRGSESWFLQFLDDCLQLCGDIAIEEARSTLQTIFSKAVENTLKQMMPTERLLLCVRLMEHGGPVGGIVSSNIAGHIEDALLGGQFKSCQDFEQSYFLKCQMATLFDDKWRESAGQNCLEFVLTWALFPVYFSLYSTHFFPELSFPDLNRKMEKALKVLWDLMDNVEHAKVTVREIHWLCNHKQRFREVVQSVSDDQGRAFCALHLREKELNAYMIAAQDMKCLLDHCHTFVRTNDADTACRKFETAYERLNDQLLSDMCENPPLPENVRLENYVPCVKLVGVPERFMAFVPSISERLASAVFKHILESLARTRGISTEDKWWHVLTALWHDTCQEWNTVCRQMTTGDITLQQVQRLFNMEQKSDYLVPHFEKELVNMALRKDTAKQRAKQLECLATLETRRKAANILCDLKEQFGFSGHLDDIKKFLEVDMSQPLKYLRLSVLDTSEALRDIAEENIKHLRQFASEKNQKFVEWVRDTMSGGLKEVKVFVELALNYVGDVPMDMDKVRNLQAVITGYAPFIFQTAGENVTFLERCHSVVCNIKADPHLPNKLESTIDLLTWFDRIHKFHGSVEKTALAQVDSIARRGILKIGRILQDSKRGMDLHFTDVINLEVPADSDSTSNPTIYSYSDLVDLQSRLMLVVGHAEQGQQDVERFISVMDSVVRLVKTYIQLCRDGCRLFLNWKVKFFFDRNRDVCCIVEFFQNQAQKLKGSQKEHSLEDYMAKVASFLDNSHDSWLQYVEKKRDEYEQLNLYTMEQLVFLQEQLALDSADFEPHLLPLLSLLLPGCTTQEIQQSLDQAAQCEAQLNDSDNEEEGEEIRTAALFIQQMEENGFSRQIAAKALQRVGDPEDYEAGTALCIEIENEETEDDMETEDPGPEAHENDSAVKLQTREGTIASALQLVQKLWPGGSFGLQSMTDQLHDVWTTFLQTVKDSGEDSLSLHHLGLVLGELGEMVDEDKRVERCLPPTLKAGSPHLLLCPRREVLNTMTSLYVGDESPLPQSDEVLLCTQETTMEQVLIFLRRAFSTHNCHKIYCLAFADLLDYEISERADKLMKEYINTSEHEYQLVIICTSENEFSARITAALERYLCSSFMPFTSREVCSFLHRNFLVPEDSTPQQSAACVDPERLSVRVVKSTRSGMGKTLYKKRLVAQLRDLLEEVEEEEDEAETDLEVESDFDDEEQGDLEQYSVTIPLYQKAVKMQHVAAVLLESLPSGSSEPKLIHMDISYEVQEGVDVLLYSLLVLGCITDHQGHVWLRSPKHLYVIEAMPLLEHNNSQQDSGMSVHEIFCILPSLHCFSPCETLSILGGKKKKVQDSGGYDRLFDKEEHQSEVFQRPCHYLRALEQNAVPTRYADDAPIIGPLDCLQTIIRHCGAEDPSWSEVHHFVSFLDKQLKDFEHSIFCSDVLARDLPGFSAFVLRFLIHMSRDFATRSTKVAEESLPVLTRTEREGDAEKTVGIEQFQLRRTWESSPHPYIFFNLDRNSMTFLGFTIDPHSGSLMDQRRRVLEQRIIKPCLYRSLSENGVPLSEDFDSLPRSDRLQRLYQVMGLTEQEMRDDDEEIIDPDDTYELTTDNVKKILAIYMRFRCNIPVIIMGETGCGKTRLVKFMCALQTPKQAATSTVVLMKVHGGTTVEDIHEKVKEAESLARETRSQFPNRPVYTVLFFDEANTTEAVGAVKEVMCDGAMNGKPIQLHHSLKMVAACNPYRKHSPEVIERLEKAGLGYHVSAEKTCDKLGRLPMRQLVYRVQPLPQSMLPLVWDFGQLTPEAERMYIIHMVRRYVRQDQVGRLSPDQFDTVCRVLVKSQTFMRQLQDECSFVSLRDADRTLMVTSWFLKQQQLLHLIGRELGPWRIENLTVALVLALGVCYRAGLRSKEKFDTTIAPCFAPAFRVHSSSFRDILERCQDVFLGHTKPALNIARNSALKENVFMMVVCVELRIPLFLVGKPGSSKSLAKSIVADAMQGTQSRDTLFGSLKEAQMVSFQCSPLATADGILATFRQCAHIQHGKDKDKFVAVAVLDEIGLAEDSPKMPLKALHPLLEDGCMVNNVQSENKEKLDSEESDIENDDSDEEEDEEHSNTQTLEKVAFIGISNWALDPAKMNRGILVQRDVPDKTELVQTAEGICGSEDPAVLELVKSLVKKLAQAYLAVFNQATNRREFFGLRDFYSLVKMIHGIARYKKRKLTRTEFRAVILRNFGGLPVDTLDPVEVFQQHLSMSDCYEGHIQDEMDCSYSSLLRSALTGESWSGESRYVLLLTENYGGLHILTDILLANETVVPIFGSSFPKDQEYTQICCNINQIKVCMETGKTVILLNLDNLYESLYDALNQYYSFLAGARYVDLGLGTHRVKCKVDEQFRLIVVAEKQTVYDKFPIPLINRLEKHFLSVNNIPTNEQRRLEKQLREWVQEKCNHSSQLSEGDMFVGYHEDTAASVILMACGNGTFGGQPVPEIMDKILRESQATLLWCATPDAVIRAEDATLRDLYFCQQQHQDLLHYLKMQLDCVDENGFKAQVTTHSKLLTDRERCELEEKLKGFSFILLSLQAFHTEQQFRHQLNLFLGGDGDRKVLLVQCERGDANQTLLQCAQYCVQCMWANNPSDRHVVFIVQLPRVSSTGFSGFLGGKWHCAHVDDLRTPSLPVPPIAALQTHSLAQLLSRVTPSQVQDAETETEAPETEVAGFHIDLVHHILTSCVQAAVARVQDEEEDSGRSMHRIAVLLSLLEKTDKNQFFTGLWRLLTSVLEEKEAGRDEPMNWLAKDAAQPDWIRRAGTFRRAWMQCIERHLIPILAGVVAYLDTNHNLDLLQQDELPPWVSNLWLRILNDESLVNFRYSDMLSGNHTELKEFVCGSTFVAKHDCASMLPFSWVIVEVIERPLIRTPETDSDEEGSEETSVQAVEMSSLRQHLQAVLTSQNMADEFLQRYTADLLNANFRLTVQQHQLLMQCMEGALRQKGVVARCYTMDRTLVDVHRVLASVRPRLQAILDMVACHPQAVQQLQEKRCDSQVVPQQIEELVEDVLLLGMLVEELTRGKGQLNGEEGRREWLDRFNKVAPVISRFTADAGPSTATSALSDSDDEGSISQGKRPCFPYGTWCQEQLVKIGYLWTQVATVKLFIDYMSPLVQGADKVQVDSKGVNYTLLWTLLGKEANLKTKKTLEKIDEFLKRANSLMVKSLLGDVGSCTHCNTKLEGAPVVLPCAHRICDVCYNQEARSSKHCPECSQEIPDDFDRDSSGNYNREAVDKLLQFQRQSSAFLMAVVSQHCFGGQGAPEPDAVRHVFGYIIRRVGGIATVRTQQLTLRNDQMDPSPVLRSFLLRLLLQHSEREVSEHITHFLDEAREMIQGQMGEAAQSSLVLTELSLLVIHCVENLEHEKEAVDESRSRAGDESSFESQCRYVKDLLHAVRMVLDSSPMELQTLTSLGRLRYALGAFARILHESVVKPEEHPAFTMQLKDLFIEASNVCAMSSTEWPKKFLIKQLCREFGIEAYTALVQRAQPERCLQWIQLDNVREVEEMPDRYLVCGEDYFTLRAEVMQIMRGQQGSLVMRLSEMRCSSELKQYLLLLALHREVTMAVLNAPSSTQTEIRGRARSLVQQRRIQLDKDFAVALCDNKLVEGESPLCVHTGQSMADQSLVCVLVHYWLALRAGSHPRDILIPLTTLLNHPSQMERSYLPTMPEDDVDQIVQALGVNPRRVYSEETPDVPRMWECPNGHRYIIGDCGNPSGRGICPECGVRIGAQVYHRAEVGNREASLQDRTQPGHTLGAVQHRSQEAVPERSMSAAACAILRFLTHAALFLSASQPEQGRVVAQMVQPAVDAAHVVTFFWGHLQQDIAVLQRILNKCCDDVYLVLHQLCHKLAGRQPGAWSRYLRTKQERSEWEKKICEMFIQPAIQQIDNTISDGNDKIVSDTRQGENQLLNLVFEVGEDAGEEASARNLQQTAAAWKFRTLITVNHFLRQFQLQTTQGSTDSLPVLRLFFEESHHLRALYFLPDILAHQHRLMQQLRKKLSRADAAQKTIGDMLDRKDCAGLKRLLELFSKAWDIVKEFLVSYRCKIDDSQWLQLPQEFQNVGVRESSPVGVLLPDTRGPGLCAYLLNHYLLVQHNNFLERYCPLVKLSYEQVPEVPVPAVTSHHLLGYSEQSDLLPLVLAHCNYSLHLGHTGPTATHLDYDFRGFELQLRNTLLLSKSRVRRQENGVMDFETMVYCADTTTARLLTRLREKIDQVSLGLRVQRQIADDYRDLSDISQSIDNLNTMLPYCITLRVDPSTRLQSFMADMLRMRDTVHSRKARQHCCLKHVQSLWLLLCLERARILAANHQEAFDDQGEHLRKDLTEEQKQDLQEALSRSSRERLDVLLQQIFECIMLRLMQQTEEGYASPDNYSLRWLVLDNSEYPQYAEDPEEKQQEELTEYDLRKFPDSVTASQAISVWLLLHAHLSGR